MTSRASVSMLASAMSFVLPLGVSDFRALREKNLVYVDKTGLLIEMLDRAGTQVLLLPRPRRFGKTLNLSMLRYFFERSTEDLSHLFEGLAGGIPTWERDLLMPSTLAPVGRSQPG